MIYRRIWIIAIILGLSSILLINGISTGDVSKETGLVTFVDGTLKKKLIDASEWTVAGKDTAVVSGEKVRTMNKSRAELALRELDVLRLAPRTTIDIIKLYEESKSSKDETLINVEEGDMWAMVGEVETGAEFNVNTPVAGAAITGTVFRMSIDKDSTTQLKVYKGEVQISNSPGNPNLTAEPVPFKERKKISGPKQVPGPKQVTFKEWLYIVKDMQSIRVDKKGELIESGDFTDKDADEQSDWVKWNKILDEERKKKWKK